MKSKTTALILSILVGGLGIDRFYLGYTGIGILKLLTAGCFGVLYLIDIINIATGNLKPADGTSYQEDSSVENRVMQNGSTAFDDLEKAAKLHDGGIISDEEFARMKEELLRRM